jgi:putative transposase
MKKSRFSEQQIAFVLRQAEEGTVVAEVRRKGRDQRGLFLQLAQEVWRADAIGDEALKQLERKNQRLKKAGCRPVAGQGDATGRDPPKNIRPARKRQMVDEVRRVWRVSIRRACKALRVDRSTYHYRSKRTGHAVLMKRIREIAETRVRYGYRRIHMLLRRGARAGW